MSPPTSASFQRTSRVVSRSDRNDVTTQTPSTRSVLCTRYVSIHAEAASVRRRMNGSGNIATPLVAIAIRRIPLGFGDHALHAVEVPRIDVARPQQMAHEGRGVSVEQERGQLRDH